MTKKLVNDHAVLKFCERILGMNISNIKERIAPKAMQSEIRKLRNGIVDGPECTFQVKDGVVVNVFRKGSAPQ